MGLFNDNTTSNPVTAESLRAIIRERYSYKGDSLEEICDKILMKIYRKVEYSIDKDVYNHKTSLAALQLVTPLSKQAIDKYNSIINEGYDSLYNKTIEDINTYNIISNIMDELGENFWNPEYLKFKNFFNSRGFKVGFDFVKFVNISDNAIRKISLLITISWEDVE